MDDLRNLLPWFKLLATFSQGLIKEVQGVGNACAQFTLLPEGTLLWKKSQRLFVPQQRSLIR